VSPLSGSSQQQQWNSPPPGSTNQAAYYDPNANAPSNARSNASLAPKPAASASETDPTGVQGYEICMSLFNSTGKS